MTKGGSTSGTPAYWTIRTPALSSIWTWTSPVQLPLCNRNTWGLSTSLKSRRTPKTSSAPTRMSSKRAGVSTIPSQTPDESHTYHF